LDLNLEWDLGFDDDPYSRSNLEILSVFSSQSAT
jgi:hypothetical protein